MFVEFFHRAHLGVRVESAASLYERAAAEKAETRKHKINDPKCLELGWVYTAYPNYLYTLLENMLGSTPERGHAITAAHNGQFFMLEVDNALALVELGIDNGIKVMSQERVTHLENMLGSIPERGHAITAADNGQFFNYSLAGEPVAGEEEGGDVYLC
ncbi:hypothetical protein EMCRGX_G021655 [Ephydatia muelleri]